jgi:CDP-paratose 2-epimerase
VKRALVTGSSGLIGSEAVTFLDRLDWAVHGIDNNMRQSFFGPDGDTTWNLRRLQHETRRFTHHELDIRDRDAIVDLIKRERPDLIIHCAAQPSHDLAARRPLDDFSINALGTVHLLEAARQHCPESPFVFMSTNKVYGDRPNSIPVKEFPTRWDYAENGFAGGIREDLPLDQCTHSIFGASKVAADVMVQEYGRYFGMKTCCLRAGCLTGPNHSAVELHGFLSYLIKCNLEGKLYRIYGYKGKQVRDNIHSFDVVRFIEAFAEQPRSGEVYNIGGGRGNSISILEAFERISALSGKKMNYEYVDQNRKGDHICYISDLSKLKSHFPGWTVTKSLDSIFSEIYQALGARE